MVTRLLPIILLCCASAAVQAQGRVRQTDLDSGRVEKGRKVGEWTYYALTGSGRKVLVQRYDYDRKRLLYFRKPDEHPYRHEVAGSWQSGYLERPPLYIGGDGALSTYMRQLQYPEQARSKNVQGRVVVRFVIDTLGTASNYQVLTGIGSGCDEEALRVARSIPHEWIPGRKDGRAVPVEYELPFTFRITQAQK
ncbi:energy transducer TonB [Solirubrum puertoriconensis]|uniref:energy transducer TonB n=1 Tax=Solirubrum puertoriconensis TaxID=1751427 RepID=UPI00099002F4|nr:energy transducer TonB [Solirubrum puertoriconensis]